MKLSSSLFLSTVKSKLIEYLLLSINSIKNYIWKVRTGDPPEILRV